MNENICNEYFAAANGFSGFRSHFNVVFDPRKFDKRFIIKGGPGTGKSTFMKRMQKDLLNMSCECEAILCSSDPKSYDGLIITDKNGKKIALIDGTAPHETDAVYPGLVDELINLGECWNEQILSKRKSELFSLHEEKKKAYKKAYTLLNFAGASCNNAGSLIRLNSNEFISAIFGNKPMIYRGRRCALKFISSFGKDGFLRKVPAKFDKLQTFTIIGSLYETEIVFKNIIDHLYSENIEFERYPSPFCDDYTDAIYICGNNTLIIQNHKQGTPIECKNYISCDDNSIADFYNAKMNEALQYSQNKFKEASDYHFELEKIYTTAMNFSLVDKKYSSVLNSICNLIET